MVKGLKAPDISPAPKGTKLKLKIRVMLNNILC